MKPPRADKVMPPSSAAGAGGVFADRASGGKPDTKSAASLDIAINDLRDLDPKSAPDTAASTPLIRLDAGFWLLAVLCAASGSMAVWLNGPGAIGVALGQMASDAVSILPIIAVGLVVGALFTTVIPRRFISNALGAQSGVRGILLASFLGTVMPGGPFASFPLVVALGRSGAGVGALVAFLTAWAVVGLNRLIIWELPLMGPEFATLRFFSSLPLPIIAGFIAHRLNRRFAALRPWSVEN